MARVLSAIVCLALGTALAAYAPILDQRSIDEAVSIGQSNNEATRTRFHLGYHVPISQPPVDYVEITTPLRRLALAVEDRYRLGDRFFTQRDVTPVLARHGQGIELVVEFTFHPLNTYVGVPDYEVFLEGSDGKALRARNLQRFSRFTPRITGVPLPGPDFPSGGQPLLGASVVGRFERADLNTDGSYAVVIREKGKELARGRVDLARMR